MSLDTSPTCIACDAYDAGPYVEVDTDDAGTVYVCAYCITTTDDLPEEAYTAALAALVAGDADALDALDIYNLDEDDLTDRYLVDHEIDDE